MEVPNISVVLNAHREGTIISYTLRSLVDTTIHAAMRGLTVELVAVLDSPDDLTRSIVQEFESLAFSRITRIEVNYRSLGPSRNAGLMAARGLFTAVVDADDIYSFNYLANMYAAASSENLCLALPSICVWFQDEWMVLRFEPLSRIGRFRLAGAHTFMSCIMAPTDFLRDLKYRDCAIGQLYAYEDWDLTCRAVAAGADIKTASDTALFYRRHRRSIMAALANERRLIPPSAFFNPDAFVLAGDKLADEQTSEQIQTDLHALRTSNVLAELALHAKSIDPRIDFTMIRNAEIWSNAMFSRDFGEAFLSICHKVQSKRIDSVLIIDAPAPLPSAIRKMTETSRQWLVIETGDASPPTTFEGNEGGVIVLREIQKLSPERRWEMTIRIIHAFAADACVHLVTQRNCDLLSCAEAFDSNMLIVYCISGHELIIPSEAFSFIDFVVFDDESSLFNFVSREPVYAEKCMRVTSFTNVAEADNWLAALPPQLESRKVG